jgi:predicted negative regulator of RcsB-dependent stress response
MGNFNKAVEILEKAAELSSFETIISDHLGDAYKKANQPGKAMETYKKALSNAKNEDKRLVLQIEKKIHALQKKINE